MNNRALVTYVADRLSRGLIAHGFERLQMKTKRASDTGWYVLASRWSKGAPKVQVWLDHYIERNRPQFWIGIGGPPASIARWESALVEAFQPIRVTEQDTNQDGTWTDEMWDKLANSQGWSLESTGRTHYCGRYMSNKGQSIDVDGIVSAGIHMIGTIRPLFVEQFGTDITIDLDALRRNKKLSSTTVQRLIDARLGQGQFRTGLIQLWQGCSVSGVLCQEVLRASHIKPWRESDDDDRLDPANGLLLTATLDALLDQGLISFSSDGEMLISPRIDNGEQGLLIGEQRRLRRELTPKQQEFMKYHREEIFLGPVRLASA